MTTLAASVSEASARILAMQSEAVPNAQAGNYGSFEYPYGNLYWTNIIGQITPPETGGYGVDEFDFRIPFLMRLHTGFLTEGYDGSLEAELQYTHIPTVIEYFYARRNLVYQAGTQPIDNYDPDLFALTCSGTRLFSQKRGNQTVQMLGANFTLTVGFRMTITRPTLS